jgi:ectoine hydroxylase-related dioxygenase (phytanoyl-CoA dioxygenase family)
MENELLEDFRLKILSQTGFSNAEWEGFQSFLFSNGIGMEETLKFINFERPCEEVFINWFQQNKSNKIEENVEKDVLTINDLAFFEKYGYLVLKNAISTEDCENTKAAILDYLDAKMEDPITWYAQNEAKEGLMVLFTKHATLEKNRNSPQIKKAYEQLYKTDQLYKTIDKVSFNPPENANYKFKGSALHWDVSLQPPIPFRLQGLLYLTDVQINSGAFHCVPGFQHKIYSWLESLPPNSNPREIAVKELKPIPVLGNAGDFIIWHQALPHCATPNLNQLPRMVQYLTYFPKDSSSVADVWI